MRSRFSTMVRPTEGRSEAPSTATERGFRSASRSMGNPPGRRGVSVWQETGPRRTPGQALFDESGMPGYCRPAMGSFDASDRQSLRGFLGMVEREFPDELLRVRTPVRADLDITSLVFELERAGRSPVVLYENVEGHVMPVVTNVAGNRTLLAACLGVSPADLPGAFRERCQSYVPCEVVGDAPRQEGVVEGDALDLATLPIPRHFSVDAAPYITAGQIAARDPITGVDTTGFHRL